MTNRSFQETAELVIFGLIALLVGLGVLWLTGWILNLLGSLFIFVSSFVWNLLRFILPVIIIAAVIYLIVRYATRGERRPASASAPAAPAVRTVTQPATAQPVASSSVRQPVTPPPPSAAPSAEPKTIETERLDVGEGGDELRRSDPEEPRER